MKGAQTLVLPAWQLARLRRGLVANGIDPEALPAVSLEAAEMDARLAEHFASHPIAAR